jgi:AcrR family transcriptional regulator
MNRREPNARGAGEQLRAELVAAASELLLAPQPIAAPSLRAVARACSVSPAAVYLHFDSQDALIAAVVSAQFRALRESVLARAAAEADSSGQLRAVALGYVEWGLAHPGAYQLLFESADRLGGMAHEGDADSDRWDLIRDVAALIGTVTGASGRDAEVAAFRAWTTLHGIVSLRIHKRDVDWPTDAAADVDRAVATFTGP